MMVMVEMVLKGVITLCSSPGADGPGREHVAADTQEVLVLVLLAEWLL